MRIRPVHRLILPLARAILFVILGNVIFIALIVVVQGDTAIVAQRIRSAFDTGELGTSDYRRFDARRGYFQHNDCLVLQMLVNRDPSRWRRAVVPTVYSNPTYNHWCETLRELVVERIDPKDLEVMPYGRYWHGGNVVAALALRVLDLGTYRRLLSIGVFLAIGVLALASWRAAPHVRRTGLSIAVCAATVWAVPYFSPGLTQGPGDALLILFLAGLAARQRMAAGPRFRIVPYAAVFGSVVVFCEMFTGQLPTAGAWLAALTLASARDENANEENGIGVIVVAALVAFGIGATLTLALKQVLAIVAASGQGEAFVDHLQQYSGAAGGQEFGLGRLRPFLSLVRQSSMLTYGSKAAGTLLLTSAAAAWGLAALRSRRSGPRDRKDFWILAAAAALPLAWVLVFSEHTHIHAWLMVRMLVVPISLAVAASVWPRTPLRFVEASRGSA